MSWTKQSHRNRVNGALIEVLDARFHPDFDEDEGGRWVTWCDRHETFSQHETLRLARWHASDPTGWCGLCAKGMD